MGTGLRLNRQAILVFIACTVRPEPLIDWRMLVAAKEGFCLVRRKRESGRYQKESNQLRGAPNDRPVMKVTPVCAAFVVLALSICITSEGDCQTDSLTEHVIRKIPFTIRSPGEYKLANDLSMSANDVAIKVADTANVVVDLNGHTLANTASVGIGIAVESSHSVTVKNGTIYGFGYGVKFDSASENALVRKVTLANDAVGVDTAADKSTIEGCFMSGPGFGSGIALAPNTTAVLARQNQIDGFSYGLQSATGSESKYNYNHISSCNVGLSVSSTDVYIGNVFTACSVDIQQGN
jgi:hypothetical protein